MSPTKRSEWKRGAPKAEIVTGIKSDESASVVSKAPKQQLLVAPCIHYWPLERGQDFNFWTFCSKILCLSSMTLSDHTGRSRVIYFRRLEKALSDWGSITIAKLGRHQRDSTSAPLPLSIYTFLGNQLYANP